MASGDRGVRNVPGSLVSRVHAGCAAERVAWKLVEQDCKRQSAVSRFTPAVERAARRLLVEQQKTLAKALVECRVLCEPEPRAGFAPEGDNGGSLGGDLRGAREYGW